MLAFAALQQEKAKYSSGITQAQRYYYMFGQCKHWIPITSRLNNLQGLDDFACACHCVEFPFHLGHLYCLRLCLRFILSFIHFFFLFACTCFANENQP